MSAVAPVGIRLSCQPRKEGGFLLFPYQIQNEGTVDVYVMDALSSIDRSSREPKADPQSAVVLHGPGDDATVGKFIAPVPTDRRVAMPAIPLARRLPPGGLLEGRLDIPIPLAETSPYFVDLPLRQYEVVDIQGVVISIGYWIAGTDGLAVLPVEYAPELLTVVTRNTIRSARRVSQRFPTRSLQLFKRTDKFPRSLPGDSGTADNADGVLAVGTGG